jgi:uncharacterized protein (TIGR01777 family)
MKILLTGGNGFVGSALGLALVKQGHEVVAVSRDPSRTRLPFSAEVRDWDSLKGGMLGIDAIFHLAGEPVAQRWTPEVKKKILASRVDTARLLREAVQGSPGARPAVFFSASAIGYYGDRGDELLREDSFPGKDFLAGVCVEWEKAAQAFRPLCGRVAIFRIGLVLGPGGGAMEKILPPFKLGLGGRLGRGEQWMSWIHLDDLLSFFLSALADHSIKGVYNAVAPAPARNKDFTRALAAHLGRPAALPVPAFALKLALGEMSAALLASERVSCEKALGAGFRFRYPDLASAFATL